MKGWAIALLVVIAAGVAYLAWSEYDRRREAADVAERISDPKGYQAKYWARSAGLDCEVATDVETVVTVSGVLRPMKFTCWPERGAALVVEDVGCTPEAMNTSTGERTPEGFYKPLAAICWKAAPR